MNDRVESLKLVFLLKENSGVWEWHTGTMSHEGCSRDIDRHSSIKFLKSYLTHENTKQMAFVGNFGHLLVPELIMKV